MSKYTISAAGLILAACATPAVEEQAPAFTHEMPATLEEGIARVDAERVCDLVQEHEIRPDPDPSPTRPQRIRTCIPSFPPVLMERGFQSACLADFTLTIEGVPTDIRTTCNTRFRGSFYASGDNVANGMFEYALKRVTGEMRFASAEGIDFIDTETRIAQPLKFKLTDMPPVDYPPGFRVEGAR